MHLNGLTKLVWLRVASRSVFKCLVCLLLNTDILILKWNMFVCLSVCLCLFNCRTHMALLCSEASLRLNFSPFYFFLSSNQVFTHLLYQFYSLPPNNFDNPFKLKSRGGGITFNREIISIVYGGGYTPLDDTTLSFIGGVGVGICIRSV